MSKKNSPAKVEDITNGNTELEVYFEGKKYYLISPDHYTMSLADMIKSKFFYTCIEMGVPTIDQFEKLLIDQGRFNKEEYERIIEELGAESSMSLVKIESAEDEESLKTALAEAQDSKERLSNHIQSKTSLLSHCAEFKADVEYNLAILAVSCFDENKKPLFLTKLPNGTVDILKTYDKLKKDKRVGLVIHLFRKFTSFIRGIVQPREIDREFEVYIKRRQELSLPEDDITRSIKLLTQILEGNDEEANKTIAEISAKDAVEEPTIIIDESSDLSEEDESKIISSNPVGSTKAAMPVIPSVVIPEIKTPDKISIPNIPVIAPQAIPSTADINLVDLPVLKKKDVPVGGSRPIIKNDSDSLMDKRLVRRGDESEELDQSDIFPGDGAARPSTVVKND